MHHDFLDKFSDLESPVHSLDARVKLIYFFLLITMCVSTPADNYIAFALYLTMLAVILVLSRIPLTHVLRKSLVIIPFVVLVSIFIPFVDTGESSGGISLGIGGAKMSDGRLLIFWNVLIKSYTSVVSLILLLATTGFPALLKGFLKLKVPVIFINLMSFFYRYVFVLIDEAQRMKRALEARMYRGRWISQAGIIGNLLGALFLRSYERGERIYLAMSARGGAANLNRTDIQRLNALDAGFLLGGAAALFIVRFLVD